MKSDGDKRETIYSCDACPYSKTCHEVDKASGKVPSSCTLPKDTTIIIKI